MKIEPLFIRISELSEKEKKEVLELQKLVPELNRREIPEEIAIQIKEKIATLNIFKGTSKEYLKKIRSSKKAIFDMLQKELGLVPKDYYTKLWMSKGLASFGLLFGVLLYAITQNPAFIALGLPLGAAMGSLHGKKLDKKAEEENKQLDLS